MSNRNTRTNNLATEDQCKNIKRFIEDEAGKFNIEALMALGFPREGAQEIIEKSNLFKTDLNAAITGLLKKHSIIDQRFGLPLAEFDFTVPQEYNHDKHLDEFQKCTKKLKTTYYFNEALNSKNYAKATNKLEPGKTYKVKIFPILETVTSEDCMNFLRKQNAILVGGQGVTLLYDDPTAREQFPIGKWTVSFDQKDALWKDSDGDHRVPRVYRRSDGDWEFYLGVFEGVWRAVHCLLCFCDLQPSEA